MNRPSHIPGTKPYPRYNVHPTIKFIIEERDRRGISDRKFSKQVGVGHGAINRWERGIAAPILYNWLDAIEALGYEVVLVPKGSVRKLPNE